MSKNYFDSGAVVEDTSNSEESSSEKDSSSEESVEEIEQTANPRGPSKNHEEKERAVQPMLSPLQAFDEIEGPPAFLDPEAIRPTPGMKPRKRKAPSFNETVEAEKKPRAQVIVAKAVTYKTPRVPDITPLNKEGQKDGTKTSSKAMAVDEFLTKGGGAMLPRRTRFQRDKEKAKREKGQSSHSTWKTEEEMVLRQQYD